MKDQSAAGILSTTIEKVRQLVDVSTIVGEPIALSDEVTVIPVSKVTYGFASGGSDFPSKNNTQLFGGGGQAAGGDLHLPVFISGTDGGGAHTGGSENTGFYGYDLGIFAFPAHQFPGDDTQIDVFTFAHYGEVDAGDG